MSVPLSASMQSRKFKLPIAALPLLARPNAALSPISPLHPWTSAAIPAMALETAGLIEHGQLQPALRSLADKLLYTHSMTMLQYQAGGTPMLWLSCFEQADSQPISLYMTGEDVIIEAPADIEAIVIALGEMLGMSSSRNCDLDLLLETADIYAWLSLADARRICQLEAIMGREIRLSDGTAIANLLASTAIKGQRLRDVIDLDDDAIANIPLETGLARLEQKGLAHYHHGAWLLSEAAENCMARLLLIDGVITLKTRRLMANAPNADNAQLVGSTIFYAQAGVNDLLAMETVSQGLRVWAECPTAALVQIRLLMQNAEIIPWLEAPETSNAIQNKIQEIQEPAPKLIYCSKCHHPLRADDHFCTQCGTPVMPIVTPHICPQCGQSNNTSAKFCSSCGFVLP